VVRIKSFTERPEDVASYGPLTDEAGRSYKLGVVGLARGAVLAAIEGVGDRDAAEALTGTRLYVDRAALPAPEEGEFYRGDLVGLAAELADGTKVGEVISVEDYGAGDIVEIARPGDKALLMPFTDATVPVVDIAGGRIVIAPPEVME
jgi:16S rRNA processing protein RimM